MRKKTYSCANCLRPGASILIYAKDGTPERFCQACYFDSYPRLALAPNIARPEQYQMVKLGFRKVQSFCVYEGPVEQLVAALKEAGWERPSGYTNPFLLSNTRETLMVFNYAETDSEPSKRFVSYFRACV